MTAPATDLTPTAPEAKTALWEDCIDIFYAPSQVFARRRDHRFGLALVVFLVAALAIFMATRSLLEPAMSAEIQRSMAKMAGQLTPDQLAQAQARGEKMQGVFAPIVFPIGQLVTVFLLALTIWIVSKFFDGHESLGGAMTIATFALFPRILQFVAVGLIAFFRDPAQLNAMTRATPSPAALFDPDSSSRVVIALLSRIDPFVFWSTALIAIGLAVLAKMPRGKAWATAIVVWALAAIPGVLGALR